MGPPASHGVPQPPQGWQPCHGIGGSFRLESVAGLLWNQWQLSCGTGGSFAVESVAGFTWNRWQLCRGIRNGSQGLEKALYSHLYGVPHQRCIFHKIKNITDHLQYGKGMIEAGEVSAPPSRQDKKERKQAILADASQI